jgi:hypothetical protein
MPEIVEKYAATKDLTALSTIYERLITAYLDDVGKYSPSDLLTHVIRHCIRASFREAGKRIKFERFGQSDYRTREKPTSAAQVDFVYPFEGQLIPIEVKSGKDGSLKSLHLFMDDSPHELAIRFYNEKFNLTEVTTPAGKSFLLLSLPYSVASKTKEYIRWLKDEGRRYLASHPISPR